MTAGLIAHFDGSSFELIREFDEEITGIAYSDRMGLICLGELGALHLFHNGFWSQISDEAKPRARLNDIVITGGRIFGLAWRANLFEHDPTNGWKLHSLAGPRSKVRLLGIAATGEEEFVVCGSRGFLKEGPLGGLTTVDVPASADITDVATNGTDVVAVGSSGLGLHRSAVGDWEVLDRGDESENLVGVTIYSDKFLVAGRTNILKVEGNRFEILYRMPSTIIANIGGTLFNLGFGRLHRLDGDTWTPIPVLLETPDRGPFAARRKS
jgi:hypothetical protein